MAFPSREDHHRRHRWHHDPEPGPFGPGMHHGQGGHHGPRGHRGHGRARSPILAANSLHQTSNSFFWRSWQSSPRMVTNSSVAGGPLAWPVCSQPRHDLSHRAYLLEAIVMLPSRWTRNQETLHLTESRSEPLCAEPRRGRGYPDTDMERIGAQMAAGAAGDGERPGGSSREREWDDDRRAGGRAPCAEKGASVRRGLIRRRRFSALAEILNRAARRNPQSSHSIRGWFEMETQPHALTMTTSSHSLLTRIPALTRNASRRWSERTFRASMFLRRKANCFSSRACRGAKRVWRSERWAGTAGSISARALPEDGKLITLEIDPHHADVSRRNFERAGVWQKVDIRVGPASENAPATGRSRRTAVRSDLY